MAELLHCANETIRTLLISYTPIEIKTFFKNEGEIRTFSDKKKKMLREFIILRLSLQEMLKGVQVEMKGH